jgi:hypothetical protein
MSALTMALALRHDRGTVSSVLLSMDDDRIRRLHARTARTLFPRRDEAALPSEISKSAYYSLIADAVSRLPNNTRDARLALYDRAEIAFTAELLQERKISVERMAVERLALERAILKIEGDARKNEKPKQLQENQQRPFASFLAFFRIFKNQPSTGWV